MKKISRINALITATVVFVAVISIYIGNMSQTIRDNDDDELLRSDNQQLKAELVSQAPLHAKLMKVSEEFIASLVEVKDEKPTSTPIYSQLRVFHEDKVCTVTMGDETEAASSKCPEEYVIKHII